MRGTGPLYKQPKIVTFNKKKLKQKNQMLYNKKTVVALTAACLFALNDAAKIE